MTGTPRPRATPAAGPARAMRFDVDAFAADHSRPLTCVHRILDVEPDRCGVTLRCETLRIRRERRERYGTELETGVPLGIGPVATVRVDVLTPAVLRFRFAAGEVVSDNATTFTIGDQFLLGEHLLVAPVLDRLGRRRAYLPEGAWMDYWRGTVLHGPRWLELEAPLEELPIFLRAGAIIPMGEPVSHSGMLDWDRLTLDSFPASSSRFVVVRDDLVETTITCTDTAATLDGRSVPCARVGGDLLVSADQPFHTCVVEKRAGAPP